VRREDDPCDADVKRLHSALAEAIPPQSRSAVVHGDYRIDNTMLDAQDATKVLAVLDWEMSTLGDPLSDAALMCVYRHPMFNMIHAGSAWASPLIPEPDDLANRYSRAAGQSLDNWDFYMALGYFKVAIIAGGIAFRARMGGGVAEDTDKVDQAVAPLISAGLDALKG
jgi:aminoglycoside phosphotransferase (APT) family kinase protein